MNYSNLKSRIAELNAPPPVMLHGEFAVDKLQTMSLAKNLQAVHQYVRCRRWTTALENEIREICRSALANLDEVSGKKQLRMVILEEIEKLGPAGMDNLREILEEYNQSVFFLSTTNKLSKIPVQVQRHFHIQEISEPDENHKSASDRWNS